MYAEQEGRNVATTIEPPPHTSGLVDDFVTACLENKSPKTPGEDGLKVMQIIDMAYLSAKLGREAAFKDLKKGMKTSRLN